MDINIDIRTLANNLSKYEKRLPYIMSDTVNNLAFDARLGIKKGVPHWLNLTKPRFIPNQVRVDKAKPRNIVAAVGFTTKLHLIDGMLKTSKGKIRFPYKSQHIAVPVGVPKTKNGGISKANRPSALMAKPNHFEAVIHGRRGIWRRNTTRQRNSTGYGISLMYVLVDKTNYAGRGPVELVSTVEKVVKRRYHTYLEKNIKRELDYALKNPKRKR